MVTVGGKFYITALEAHGGAGTVSYEDGHVAYTADFKYSINENGKIKISEFKIRE
jgi:prepilin-type processing-associated H-X9-DG protein